MGPTNQEASGQEKKPLPPKEEECGCRDQRRETEIVAFAKQPVIMCETFLVGKDISIQTFPTWHQKPVSVVDKSAFWRVVDRGDSGRPSHHGRSPRLASSGFSCPGPCFWRLELREGVDVEPHKRGQVARRYLTGAYTV